MAKIMLVEDDTNLSEIYQARLTAEGYEIVSAHDGEEALALAAKEKPDLIISDVMMPKISGFEMLDILRNTEGLKETKVIMLTALGQADDRSRAQGLGANRYLVKSQVTLEDIVKAAQELLSDDGSTPPAATPATTPAPDTTPVTPTPPTQPRVASTPVATPVATPPAPAAAAPQPTQPAAPAVAPATVPVATPPEPQQPVSTPNIPVATPPQATQTPAPATTSTTAQTTDVPTAPPVRTSPPVATAPTPPPDTTPVTPTPPTQPRVASTPVATPVATPPAPAAAAPQPTQPAAPAVAPATVDTAAATDSQLVTGAVEDLEQAAQPKPALTPAAPSTPTPPPASKSPTDDTTTNAAAPAAAPAPQPETSDNDHVAIAHKKIIQPIDNPDPKPNLEALLAAEERKASGSDATSNSTPAEGALEQSAAAPSPYVPHQPGHVIGPDVSPPSSSTEGGIDPNRIAL